MGQPRQEVLWGRGRRGMREERLEPEDGDGRREMSPRKDRVVRGFVGGDSQAGWHSSICLQIFFAPFLPARQGMANTTAWVGYCYPRFTCKGRVIQR